MADFWNTDLSNLLKQDNSFSATPFGMMSPGGNTTTPGTGTSMGGMDLSAILASLGTAFAPEQYNKFGQRVPSWQEKLGGAVGGMARANMKAKALAAPGAGSINPLLLQLLLASGGK
jgi:hypothetical protein